METKVNVTMADAVEAYKARLEEELRQRAEENRVIEAELLEKLNGAGFSPLRVERNVAFFDHEGQEVKFRVWKDYGQHWMQRIDICPECRVEKHTYDRPAQLASFGELLVKPLWEYHYCAVKESAETPEERLISALREVLGLQVDL